MKNFTIPVERFMDLFLRYGIYSQHTSSALLKLGTRAKQLGSVRLLLIKSDGDVDQSAFKNRPEKNVESVRRVEGKKAFLRCAPQMGQGGAPGEV